MNIGSENLSGANIVDTKATGVLVFIVCSLNVKRPEVFTMKIGSALTGKGGEAGCMIQR